MSKLGKSIIEELQKISHKPFPKYGFIAGQSVAEMFFSLKNIPIKTRIKDIDIFLPKQKKDEHSYKDQIFYKQKIGIKKSNISLKKFKDASLNDFINESVDNIFIDSIYEIDNINLIEFYSNTNNNDNLLKKIVDLFDINSVQIGVCLVSGKIYMNKNFRNFVETKQVEIVNFRKPISSLTRFMNKSEYYEGAFFNFEATFNKIATSYLILEDCNKFLYEKDKNNIVNYKGNLNEKYKFIELSTLENKFKDLSLKSKKIIKEHFIINKSSFKTKKYFCFDNIEDNLNNIIDNLISIQNLNISKENFFILSKPNNDIFPLEVKIFLPKNDFVNINNFDLFKDITSYNTLILKNHNDLNKYINFFYYNHRKCFFNLDFIYNKDNINKEKFSILKHDLNCNDDENIKHFYYIKDKNFKYNDYLDLDIKNTLDKNRIYQLSIADSLNICYFQDINIIKLKPKLNSEIQNIKNNYFLFKKIIFNNKEQEIYNFISRYGITDNFINFILNKKINYLLNEKFNKLNDFKKTVFSQILLDQQFNYKKYNNNDLITCFRHEYLFKKLYYIQRKDIKDIANRIRYLENNKLLHIIGFFESNEIPVEAFFDTPEEIKLLSDKLLKENQGTVNIIPDEFLNYKDYIIKQISSKNGLITIGSVMKHCVGGYSDVLENGQALFFDIFDNINRRYTLMVNCKQNIKTNKIELSYSQMKLKMNKEPEIKIFKDIKFFIKNLETKINESDFKNHFKIKSRSRLNFDF